MKEAYEEAEDGYCGYPIHSDEKLEAMVLEALKDGQQLLAHCNGDAAAEQYVRVFEKVSEEHPEISLKPSGYDSCPACSGGTAKAYGKNCL